MCATSHTCCVVPYLFNNIKPQTFRGMFPNITSLAQLQMNHISKCLDAKIEATVLRLLNIRGTSAHVLFLIFLFIWKVLLHQFQHAMPESPTNLQQLKCYFSGAQTNRVDSTWKFHSPFPRVFSAAKLSIKIILNKG